MAVAAWLRGLRPQRETQRHLRPGCDRHGQRRAHAIESTATAGNGNPRLTGSLGDVRSPTP